MIYRCLRTNCPYSLDRNKGNQINKILGLGLANAQFGFDYFGFGDSDGDADLGFFTARNQDITTCNNGHAVNTLVNNQVDCASDEVCQLLVRYHHNPRRQSKAHYNSESRESSKPFSEPEIVSE